MEIVFSWAHSDPYYPRSVPPCGLLVSVPNVSSVWTARRLPGMPALLMIDSGGYQTRGAGVPRPYATFTRQVDMAADHPRATLCVLDAALPRGHVSARERHERVERTIANAHAYWRYAQESDTSRSRDLMAIVQGNDPESLRYCAEELCRIGFIRFGVGGLAPLYHTAEIVRRVLAVSDIVGSDLHVFGVSAIATMRELARLGIRSVDTARPMHAAFCNELLYSRPFRRFGIVGTRYPRSLRPKFAPEQQISAPLPCACPPCQENPSRLLHPRGQAAIHHRALHNAYHLWKEVESMH
jgi:tRNA-guanine family transglycosylase